MHVCITCNVSSGNATKNVQLAPDRWEDMSFQKKLLMEPSGNSFRRRLGLHWALVFAGGSEETHWNGFPTGRCRPSPSGEARVLGGSLETGLQGSCVHPASPGQQDRTASGTPSAHPGASFQDNDPEQTTQETKSRQREDSGKARRKRRQGN